MSLLQDPQVVPQHMRALAKANEVRLARAALKGRVAAGELTVAEVVGTSPWEAETMALSELLMCQVRWGTTRARKFLKAIPLSETKTIGSMSPRQRSATIALAGPPTGVSAPAPQPALTPQILDTAREQRREEALVCKALIGNGGRTSAEIDLALREGGCNVPDIVALLTRMKRRGVVWRDQSTGYALYGVDLRFRDA